MTSHEEYSAKLELPFPLLSDTEKTVCREYGVLKPIVSLITRTVLVIDRNMQIMYRQQGMPPMAEVIAAVKEKGVV
jgi:peroxiredoxin Q/BCP